MLSVDALVCHCVVGVSVCWCLRMVCWRVECWCLVDGVRTCVGVLSVGVLMLCLGASVRWCVGDCVFVCW